MLLEPEELKKSSEIDPSIVEFARANPAPDLDWADYQTVRAGVAALSAMALQQFGPPEAGLEEYHIQVTMRDGYKATVKVHRPSTKPEGSSPLIVLNFGGGWISGSKDDMTPTARAFVRAFGAVVVNTGYRLAPEHKFPTSQNDCWDTLKWAAAHADELGADPSKGFIVGGISAGGNCTAVVSTLAVEEKLSPPLTGQWLCVPALLSEKTVPDKYKKYFLAHEHNVDVPILPLKSMDVMKKLTGWDEDSPLRYPVLSKAPLSSLPPTFLQADGLDPLRDDALIYDEMLKEAGVETRIDFYPGCPHAHFAFMPTLEVSIKALGDIMTGMGWLLRKEITAAEGLGHLAPKATA